MTPPLLAAFIVGNVTLDVLCSPVDDVPRHESIGCEQAAVGPGGCASNTAVVLASLGVPVGIAACIGHDDAARFARRTWQTYGVDDRFVTVVSSATAVSVGLVDSAHQPRFIHTSGANAALTPDRLQPQAYAAAGARWLHLGGYFVLPGLLTPALAEVFHAARRLGLRTSLDVVTSPAMSHPEPLWPVLPQVDVFFCNLHEGRRLTGESTPAAIAAALRTRGAATVIVKLGSEGCYLADEHGARRLPAPAVSEVVDTTGAGDAFAAGYIAAALQGASPPEAAAYANRIGAQAVTALGAVAAFPPPSKA